ncbi:fumarylacetoacetate hydrolase FahA [Xylogone sp. PMI_703]|nr:fumarylacetoacetate hydrolase FahA [Xylogone sp. PMI_703]
MYADHFSINNIPFGIASCALHPKLSVATRFEDTVLFLDELVETGLLDELEGEITKTFSQAELNAFISLPKSSHNKTRSRIQALLTKYNSSLESLPKSCASPISDVTLHLPLSIPDFTDFMCSRDHIYNASEAMTGRRELPPAFEHFPTGYGGRSSTVVVSGTDVVRPKGQFRGDTSKNEPDVVYGPTRRLDYELEIGAVIGKPSVLGTPVKIEDADDHIFGICLLNDWSARDIQGFEMVPLGPLYGKSFMSSISPWILTLDALAPFKCAAQPHTIPRASYLSDPSSTPTYPIRLKATVHPAGQKIASTICESQFSDIYWTLRDLVAQQTCNGCSIRTGDLLGSGTISGYGEGKNGCLMETVIRGGAKIKVFDEMYGQEKEVRKVWLDDGDVVTISGYVSKGVGFGECVGRVVGQKR